MCQLKNILIIFGVLLLFSCAKKEERIIFSDKIEIYLTNKDILNENCVFLSDYKPHIDSIKEKHPRIHLGDLKVAKKIFQIDTITKSIKHKGDFNISKKELQQKPIVFDNEIKSFNIKTLEFEIDSTAQNRIRKTIDSDKLFYGKQFVMLYNNNIIIKGYFVGSFSSCYLDWHVIDLPYIDKPKDGYIYGKKMKLCKHHTYKDSLIPKISSYKKLIEAFKYTNRLIE